MRPTYDHPTAFSLWGEEEQAAIARVVASGRFTMGEEVEAFEKEFADAHHRKYAIMVNSGSSANLVAVAAMMNHPTRPLHGPRHGGGYRFDERGHGVANGPADVTADRAIVPALAWSTTYAPLVQNGLDLLLADVDETWNARPIWREMTRLIVICSILGNPCYGAEWRYVANDLEAFILEDNCESFWAMYPPSGNEQRRCGNYGTISTFSFFYSHQISAIEGGMILTDDSELDRLCRMLRAHGWSRDVAPPESFESEYDFRVFGYNVRPVELHAAIAREQLRKADQFRQLRMINAHWFHEAVKLAELPLDLPAWRGQPNPFGLHFLCKTSEDRARLVKALRANGVDCRLPTGGSFRRHAYGARWRNQRTPEADAIHDRGLFLGNAPFDISNRIEHAVRVMKDALERTTV